MSTCSPTLIFIEHSRIDDTRLYFHPFGPMRPAQGYLGGGGGAGGGGGGLVTTGGGGGC
jgi:hypothetical protein